MKRYHIGILTSHPIQYQAEWFRALQKKNGYSGIFFP